MSWENSMSTNVCFRICLKWKMASTHSSWAHFGRTLSKVNCFYLGEELKDRSLREEEAGEDPNRDVCKEIESKYCLTFLKKRARPNTDSSEDLKQIEMLPGGTLKPLKKTQ